jgi:hypothetical protein
MDGNALLSEMRYLLEAGESPCEQAAMLNLDKRATRACSKALPS